MTSAVGLAFPHSIALTVRTDSLDSYASRSCDQLNSSLRFLTFTPIVVDNMGVPFLRAAIHDFNKIADKAKAAPKGGRSFGKDARKDC